MAKDYLEEYRKSVKEEYEIQKNGIHSYYLRNPSLAKLRDLCIIQMRNNSNINDLASFRLFFDFDFSIENANNLNLQVNMNKFKPISNFFKGKSTLTDDNGLNLAAILVGFNNRPYNKFSKMPLEEQDKNSKGTSSEQEIIDEKKNISSEQKDNNEDEKKPIIPILGIIDKPTESPITETTPIKFNWFNKNIKNVTIGTVLLVTVIFGINHFTKEKSCMTWVKDHYEEIDCNALNENPNLIIVAKDDNLIQNFRKIIPCDTTKYERNGRTCLWYGKSLDGKYEFFTALYFHPETGITLKKVTSTIMKNYGRGPCE